MKTFAVSYSEQPESEKSRLAKFMESVSWPRVILILLILVFVISVGTKTASQTDGLAWLFGSNKAVGGALPADIAVSLGPILALALAIERLIETIFDMFESNIEQVAKYTAAGKKGLEYIRDVTALYNTEMFNAKDALREAMANSNTSPEKKNELVKALEDAEQRLKDAGSLWENLPKDPRYISWKRALSIWLGLFVGMVVAVFNEQGLFYYLNLPVPRLLDMFVTGFVLGAGSGPMHSLIGILQSAKETLANAGSFTGFGSVQNELRSLRAEIVKK